jgi:hypothetical protein
MLRLILANAYESAKNIRESVGSEFTAIWVAADICKPQLAMRFENTRV